MTSAAMTSAAMTSPAPTPVALTIAGSDSSGGAGIQADLKTFTALGVYGASVVTALTAQNTTGVRGVLAVPPEFILAQIEAVASDLNITAVKTGMLGDRATVLAVAEAVQRLRLRPLIVDPVMVATSGAALLAPDAVTALRETLIPLADLLTPNLPEAAALLGGSLAANVDAAKAQARDLLSLGAKAVLLKGGHGTDSTADDILATSGSTIVLSRPRIQTANSLGVHGTGCTLSAAITAYLARGIDLFAAVEQAKSFVWDAINHGQHLSIGQGTAALDHMFRIPPIVKSVSRP